MPSENASDGILTGEIMKKILCMMLLGVACTAWASEADDRLLGAQTVYRTLLQNQNKQDSKIAGMQSDLEDARRRLQTAQADIARLESEIAQELSLKSSQIEVLQQAGQRLDEAWNAVYGIGGTRAQQ